MATATATAPTANFTAAGLGGNPLATSAGAMAPMQLTAPKVGELSAAGSGALTLSAPGPFGAVKQILNQPAVKKSLPMMVVALALLAFALVYTLMNAPAYRSVISGVTESDQQAAFEALKAGEFKPVIDTTNGQITVPASRYHEARLYLASKGLPKTAQSGIESLKDQSAMTTSQFMEQVRYNAAMEQELARSITQIDSIQSARVHLAINKPSVFVRDRTPPKASVVVTPFAGRMVSPSQVQALVHLVASSVPMLTPENVTVVDNNGKMITETASDAAMGMSAGQTKHKQNLEDLYRQRIIQLLAPIVGDANVRSQVNLTLDFSQTETTVEDFDTRDKGPRTRSEVVSEDRNSAKEAGGVPGTLSNTAPAQPTTTLNTTANPAKAPEDRSTVAARSTRNYELDRSVRHTKGATGAIERLSVAVVVNERAPLAQPKNDKGEAVEAKPNPYTPQELERLQELVRGVVGYSEERDDVVTVVQARFEPEVVVDMSVPWYKDEALVNGIKSAMLGLVFIAFLLLVVRPVVLHLMNRDKLEAQEAASLQIASAQALLALGDESGGGQSASAGGGTQTEQGETLEQMKAKLKPKKSNISMEMLDTANTYDDKVALVRMIVAEDSARVANVLKSMIKLALPFGATRMADNNKAELLDEGLAKELAAMSSTERAAVLMLLLGEQQAADIIRYLNPKEVQALGASMVGVSDLSQEAVNSVLDEFVATIKRQTNLGLGTTDYVEKVLRRALGDDKAASVLGRITPGHGSKGLEILSWMDARSIADMIQDEHPQVVAIILSVLEHEVAADVLIFLPADSRAEVMQRVASLETVQPSAMEELEAIMKKQFSTNSSAKSSSFGGIKAAAKIMNLTKTDLEASVMKSLGELDADLTQRIQDNMFTFENLTGVDNKGIQVLMRNVEPDLMMSALKGANEEVKEKFFSNMSERARGMFRDDMEAKGPMRLADVETAQKTIMRIARKLSDAGELVLGGGADYV